MVPYFAEVIDDSKDNVDPLSHWIPYLDLLVYDYEALVGGKWITDSIINAGQKLLRSVYPVVPGLQVTTLGEVLAYIVWNDRNSYKSYMYPPIIG